MIESVRDFYDHLADEYHLIYADWQTSVRRQGAVLDRLIRTMLGAGPHAILDCACGIGTQAIGLAARGHRVTATDISEASVERARKEAAAFGVDATFDVADMRKLEDRVAGPFDVVIACDNSLPHLVTDEDLATAARAMHHVLRPGALFIASTRDYDQIVEQRPQATMPQVFDGPEGKRVVFQVWEWADAERSYTVQLFIARQTPEGWRLTQHATEYRALVRTELNGFLAAAGFLNIRWHTPAETGFVQPVVTARKA
jgi:glycine/sarcosine N-methyltransferase